MLTTPFVALISAGVSRAGGRFLCGVRVGYSDAGKTWGLVVNKAMACGLPAIVCDQAGCAAEGITKAARSVCS